MTDHQALLEKAKNAYSIWLTTARADGMPQPTPVWFIPEGETFFIYTTPDTQKLRNIEANNKVALGYAGDVNANSYVVLMGTAEIEHRITRVDQHAAYVEKYRDGMLALGLTPEAMGDRFVVGIRVTVQHIRGE